MAQLQLFDATVAAQLSERSFSSSIDRQWKQAIHVAVETFAVFLTLSLPTNCITDAVSSRDLSPEKTEQTKVSAWGAF